MVESEIGSEKMTTSYDYETRWRILAHLILSEIDHLSFKDKFYKIDEGEDLRRVVKWMIAIDKGIKETESIKKAAMENGAK